MSTPERLMFQPMLIRRENGGWLAVSPDGAPLRLGVVAWSADDARTKFARELREWWEILEREA